MEPNQILVLITIAVAMVFFVKEWLPVEITSLAAAAVLVVSGILSIEDFTRGFSNSAPITIGCMFVLSAALDRTGVIERLSQWLLRVAKGSLNRALALVLIIPLPLSAMINNTPIVVILLPAIIRMARTTGMPASKLLIPLSFATILGGTCSMVGTSTNLIVGGAALSNKQWIDAGLPAFSLFSIAPLGVVYAIVGVAYIYFFGVRLLPRREALSELIDSEQEREYLLQAQVQDSSPFSGRPLLELLKGPLAGMQILEVRRRGVNLMDDIDSIVLTPGDRLLVRAGSRSIHELRRSEDLAVGFETLGGLAKLETREAVILEGIIGPESSLVGRTASDIRFRQRYNLLLLAIHRRGKNITAHLETMPLQFGDTLLVEGPREGIKRLLEEKDFIALTQPESKPMRRHKAPIALAAMGGFVAGGLLGVDTTLLALLGALAVVILGCVKPQEAYSAIEWRILFLIIGMLALGRAMDTTGTAALLASSISYFMLPLGAVAMLSAVYFMASFLTELISNNAVAALLTPIAISMAVIAEASPVPFVIALMFGASASFATPIGYQTNTYVYGAGGYRFSDFLKIGVPLNLILWATATLVIPLIWPLFP